MVELVVESVSGGTSVGVGSGVSQLGQWWSQSVESMVGSVVELVLESVSQVSGENVESPQKLRNCFL